MVYCWMSDLFGIWVYMMIILILHDSVIEFNKLQIINWARRKL